MIFATFSLRIVLLFLPASIGLAAESGLDTAKIESITGLKGVLNEKENSFKVSKPRNDVAITVDQARLAPFMGFTSWAAFIPGSKDSVMVMGDMVLTEDQVNPTMSAALDNGLEVTALHNHFFWDTPKVMFMHIGGMGEEKALAGAVGKVFARLKETAGGKGVVLHADIDPAKTSLTPAKIEAILVYKGDLKDGVYKVVVGRTTKMGGKVMGKAMGVNTWAAFAGSDENAVVDGDFAMLESEVQSVLKALRAGGIDVVAIHNHMTNENPRIVFLHFWGVGPTESLAKAIKAALDKTNNPDQARFYPYLTGYVAFYTGDFKTAIADLQKADQHDPLNLVMLAQAYEKSGDAAQAKAYYTKVLELNVHNPTNAFARPLAKKKIEGGS